MRTVIAIFAAITMLPVTHAPASLLGLAIFAAPEIAEAGKKRRNKAATTEDQITILTRSGNVRPEKDPVHITSSNEFIPHSFREFM